MPSETSRIGYITKMYPRFSETFIVTEILAREAAGEEITIFSLRPPVDPRFHPELARVNASVQYIDRPLKALSVWDALRQASLHPRIVAGFTEHLDDFLAESADDAVQALLVATQARELGLTHLHAHFGSMATTVARLASLASGIPYSFTAHAKDIFHESVDDADLEKKLRDAAFTVTVSDFNLAHLRERFPGASDGVVRVYNGLELERFPVTPRPTPVGPLRVLAVGRLVEKKGFGVLVEATKRLRAAGVDIIVEIVGGGEQEQALTAAVERAGLDPVVHLSGPRPQHEIAQLLRAADVFVAPCLVAADGNADGLPTVLLEAMASGTPCVSTSVTGIPEVIRDGETGILLSPGSVDELTDALSRLAAGEVDVDRLVRNARRLIESEFDSQRQAESLRSLTVAASSSLLEEVA